MSDMTLGPINRILVLGGTQLAVEVASMAVKRGGQGVIITSPRQYDEIKNSPIETHVVERLADAPLGDMSSTLAISLGAAWIFTPETIKTRFNDRLVNLHGLRLPQYRGGGTWTWQVLSGNRLGFCLLHRVDGGVDTGDILAYEEFLYPHHCRYPIDFISEYNARNLAFLNALVDRLFKGPVTFKNTAQMEHLSTYWPRVSTQVQGWIDWSWSAQDLERFICAFDDPYSGAQTFWNGQMVSLKHAQLDRNDPQTHPFQNGLVYRNNGKWLMVAASGASIIVEQVMKDGVNILSDVKVGDRFHTPHENLDAAKQRVIFTPTGIKS